MGQKKKLTLQLQTALAWKENIVVLWFDLIVKYEASCWEIEMQF
jgi:hypothetical protein